MWRTCWSVNLYAFTIALWRMGRDPSWRWCCWGINDGEKANNWGTMLGFFTKILKVSDFLSWRRFNLVVPCCVHHSLSFLMIKDGKLVIDAPVLWDVVAVNLLIALRKTSTLASWLTWSPFPFRNILAFQLAFHLETFINRPWIRLLSLSSSFPKNKLNTRRACQLLSYRYGMHHQPFSNFAC